MLEIFHSDRIFTRLRCFVEAERRSTSLCFIFFPSSFFSLPAVLFHLELRVQKQEAKKQ